MYTRLNFFKYTFAIFKKVAQPEQFLKPHYISKHGSQYFFTDEGVYRYSNHWGRVGNCRWRLDGIDFKQQTAFWGFCSWDKFFKNNDVDSIFYIEQVGENQFTYNHIKNSDNANIVCRSANDTAKIIKKLHEICTETVWAKHLKYEDFSELQAYFIKELITTRKTFNDIKRAYLKTYL